MEGSIEFIATVFRMCLGTLFVVAGLSKLGTGGSFERAIRGYGLVPAALAPIVARALPPFELIAGFLLVAGVGLPVVAVALGILLGVFTFAVAFNLARGRRIDCGCFGAGLPRTITWVTAFRNLGLAFMAIFIAWAAPQALALDSLLRAESTAHSDGVAASIVASAAVAAIALVIQTSRIRAVIRRTTEVLS